MFKRTCDCHENKPSLKNVKVVDQVRKNKIKYLTSYDIILVEVAISGSKELNIFTNNIVRLKI